MMEIYKEQFVLARKNHRCHICGEEISAKTKYYRESGKYDGEFFDRCTCRDCYAHRQEYCDEAYDNEYDDYSIAEFLANKYCSHCSDEQKDECDTDMWHCPILLEMRSKNE